MTAIMSSSLAPFARTSGRLVVIILACQNWASPAKTAKTALGLAKSTKPRETELMASGRLIKE